MRHFIAYCALIVGSFGSYTCYAQDSQIDQWHIGNWSGALIKDGNGYFVRCVTAVGFQSGTTLSFSLNRSGDIEIRMTNNNWNLSKAPRVTIMVDSSPIVIDSYGTITRPAQILINIENNYSVFEKLRRGKALSVQSDFDGVDGNHLSLSGSSKALYRMGQCVPAAAPRTATSPRPTTASENVPIPVESNISLLGEAVVALGGAN